MKNEGDCQLCEIGREWMKERIRITIDSTHLEHDGTGKKAKLNVLTKKSPLEMVIHLEQAAEILKMTWI